MPRVSFLWLFYVVMAGYLIGWTSRHFDKNSEASWSSLKVVWWVMGGIGLFILGYSVAGIVLE